VALHRARPGFDMTAARPPGYDRPWARRTLPSEVATTASPATPAARPDATPRPEDLEPGDQ
jgi:hypothetical protein